MQKLKHLSTQEIVDANVFAGVTDYESMMKAIIKYGKDAGDDQDLYNDRVGAAFEVYAEFFLTRYGTKANPHLGILNIQHTSSNKYQVGYDYTYQNNFDQLGYLQVKFRSNPTYAFTRNDLGTFISIADEDGVPRERRMLFTSIVDEPSESSNGVFCSSYPGGRKQMRVLARNHQESFLDRDPTFWKDFEACLGFTGAERSDFLTPPHLRSYQDEAMVKVNEIFDEDEARGRFICATGGGKTRIIYEGVMQGFKLREFTLQVIVAPTIDLLRQHHEYFENFGTFHRDGIGAFHFRTGEEARSDGQTSYAQSTSVKDLVIEGRQIIFVTYASQQKLFEGLRDLGVFPDTCFWDEFHHTVRQDADHRAHMLDLPAARNLFFSASQKLGRLVSSMDEEIYGPLMIEISYKRLREMAVLVPKIIIKPLVINTKGVKVRGLNRALTKAAKRENFNLEDAVAEGAAMIVARQDMLRTQKVSNIVTFSKAVPICKELVTNEAVIHEISGLLQTVHAGVPGVKRKEIYNAVKQSSDSVLCQYSVVKEGIDINPFNAVIFSRGMDVIGSQQGIGRAVRANPQDTKDFEAGLLSLGDPSGWRKYSATIYVVIRDADDITFREYLKQLVYKLQFAGLTADDYEFAEISEERHGANDNENDWIPPVPHDGNVISRESLEDMVKAVTIEIEEEEQFTDEITTLRKQSMYDLI